MLEYQLWKIYNVALEPRLPFLDNIDVQRNDIYLVGIEPMAREITEQLIHFEQFQNSHVLRNRSRLFAENVIKNINDKKEIDESDNDDSVSLGPEPVQTMEYKQVFIVRADNFPPSGVPAPHSTMCTLSIHAVGYRRGLARYVRIFFFFFFGLLYIYL